MSSNPFWGTSSGGGLWPSPVNIDLRDEMHAILFGGVDIPPQGHNMVLRELTDQFCSCWNGVETGSIQPKCAYCQGEGYLWRERQIVAYLTYGVAPVYKPAFQASGDYPQTSWGFDDNERAIGFCEYTTFPNYERYTIKTEKKFDKLYDLKVGPSGSLIFPNIRTAKWKVLDVLPYRGDNGRIEYFMLSLAKETVS